MKLHLIICVLIFYEKVQSSRLSKAENYFFVVQSGVTQSNACILKEFPVDNYSDPMIHCGLSCNALSQCVGVDVIGHERKSCRLLYGFTALIPKHATSDETVRYQKVWSFIHLYDKMEWDYSLIWIIWLNNLFFLL